MHGLMQKHFRSIYPVLENYKWGYSVPSGQLHAWGLKPVPGSVGALRFLKESIPHLTDLGEGRWLLVPLEMP